MKSKAISWIGIAVFAASMAAIAGSPYEKNIKVIKADGEDGKDIVEVTAGSPDHKTLLAAVQAAGLVESLSTPGPLTVFAPTDAAFAKLPKGTVETLLKTENLPKLRGILEHHTAAPKFGIEILAQQKELDMVDGTNKLKIETKQGKIFVEGIEIKTAILAKNGIIYIVDSVILPK